MRDALTEKILELMERKGKVRRGIPWAGFKREPEAYPHSYPLADGARRVFPGRAYIDTGRGWRVLNKPVSRRKKRILARRTA